jgi:hypothetical protein
VKAVDAEREFAKQRGETIALGPWQAANQALLGVSEPGHCCVYEGLALRRHLDEHPTAVVWVSETTHKVTLDHSVDAIGHSAA